jgi:acetylornithine deacetylase/succinyl-diaminopimelate desuccinylase-like protein
MSTVKGEPQLNVIPQQCRALLDIRTIPGQCHEVLKKQLADIVQEEERSISVSLQTGPLKEIREEFQKGLSKGISFQARLDVTPISFSKQVSLKEFYRNLPSGLTSPSLLLSS